MSAGHKSFQCLLVLQLKASRRTGQRLVFTTTVFFLRKTALQPSNYFLVWPPRSHLCLPSTDDVFLLLPDNLSPCNYVNLQGQNCPRLIQCLSQIECKPGGLSKENE